MSSSALQGIRVIDLGRILAAPFATQLLGDLGADVIKIERPGVGDDARQYGPPFLEDDEGKCLNDAAFYLSCNRNKRSVTIDYSTPEGAGIIRDLIRGADVFVENFRTGVLAKYGLDYQSLSSLNPRLVYCSVTGYGQDGPYAHRPGYDGVFQAMSGMMSVSGLPDGVPGGGPMKVGISMVDILTGLYSANAIQAGLRHRDRTGQGQFIDMALLDCGLAALSHYAQSYLMSGIVPSRRGNGGFGGIPSQTFRCADREIFIVASTNKQFDALCRVIGQPDLADDLRFRNVSDRISNRDALLSILDEAMARRTVDEWLSELEAADVPASPVNDMRDVFANPQIQHRQMLDHVEHKKAGRIAILRDPIRFSVTPIEGYRAPPVLGANTDEVLGELLGFSAEKLRSLHDQGVV